MRTAVPLRVRLALFVCVWSCSRREKGRMVKDWVTVADQYIWKGK